MRNKFKKRLLGIILTILMVVGVIPVQQVQPVKAVSEGKEVYFDTSNISWFTDYGALPAVIFKNGTNNGDDVSKWQVMTKKSTNVWSATVPKGATYVQFKRTNIELKEDWGGTATLPLDQVDKNCFVANGWNVKSWENSGEWISYAGNSGGETTSYFNVNATLVDYFNDNRVGAGQSEENRFNNQGNQTGPENAPYSQLNKWISGLAGYALNEIDDPANSNAPVPLYFGDLLHANQAGGKLNWYWRGANVAFGTNEKDSNNVVAQGIVGKNLDANGNLITSYKNNGQQVKVPFFNENAYEGQDSYMKFYNNLQFPFTKTTNDKGASTYSFDSEYNNVYYDYKNNKIVRDDKIVIQDASKENSRGYFPFNSSNPEDKSNLNYGFGTQFTIPFTVTKDGRNVDGSPMEFNFTGDDDVWVYIDGALVLDMGGAHEKAKGEINFETQTATIETGTSDAKLGNNKDTAGGRVESIDNKKSTVNFSEIIVKKSGSDPVTLDKYMKESGTVHELKMYYMERGMWNSNMSISYSFVPLPSGLTLSKTLDTTNVNAGLKNAVQGLDDFNFKIQTMDLKKGDKDYSDVDDLGYTLYGDNENTFPGQEAKDSTATFSSSYFASDFINTKNNSSAFYAGTGFKITEFIPKVTILQYDVTKTKWRVYDSAISREAIEQKDSSNVAIFNMGDAKSSEMDVVNRYVNFVNTPKVGSLSVKKIYEGNVPEDKNFGFTVKVDLTGGKTYIPYELEYTIGSKIEKTDEKGHFTLKAGEKITFEGIPAGATYEVVEDKPDAGDTWEQATTSNVTGHILADRTIEASVTNKTKTTVKDYVIYAEAGKPVTYAPDGVTITELTAPPAGDTDIKTDVKDGKGEFTPTSPNKKYDVAYKGNTTDKGNFEGTITVYTYQAMDKVYVFDYGLESNIAQTNNNHDGLFEGGTFYNDNAKGAYETTAKLNHIDHEKDDNQQTKITAEENVIINKNGSATGAVTFKPVAFMDKAENYTYTADITKKDATLDTKDPETGTTVTGTIKTMPANVVYYEDDFNEDSEKEDGTTKIVYTGTTSSKEGTSPDVKLTQSNGQTEQYGHDDAYTKGTGDSNGTSRKMTDGAKATFTFTGTGFDVIARTTRKTAGITYIVSKKVDDSWTAVSVGAVDTYYANGDLYQIPVIHEDLKERDTYKVTLRATESTKADVIYLDGIRIYNPLGTAGNENYIDNEEGATFVKVSDLVLGNGKVTETGIEGDITNQVIDGSKAAILDYAEGEEKALSALGYTRVENNTDGSEGSTTSDSILQYLQAGPNNEVYLDDNAAVAFVATADSKETNKTIQVEAKLADLGQYEGQDPEPSEGMALRVLGADGTENPVANVTSSTAMYYSIDLKKCIDLGNDQYLVVIVGNSDYVNEDGTEGTHCISFTNIKYKGYEFSNPYKNDTAKENIDMSAFGTNTTKFVSIDFPSLRKNKWNDYSCSVTLKENVFGDGATPKFKLYYKNTEDKLKPISVTAQRTKDNPNKYKLRFRAPNALGNFAVELHYVVNGVESKDYIATTMTVKR